MPVTGPKAPDGAAGLSAHARELWRASVRYRRLADALASNGMVDSAPAAAAPAPTVSLR